MKPHFVKYFLRAIVVVLLLTGASQPASAEVLKIVVDDAIHPITEEYISRALAEADRNHDQAVLIELDTPGGYVQLYAHHH
jgi:membrane-bound ClpP family serine protease